MFASNAPMTGRFAALCLVLCLTLAQTGKTWGGDITGTILQQGTLTPLENIDIDVFDSNLISVATVAKSDVLGQYAVTGLPAGNYIIRADPNVTSGYVDQYSGGVFLRSQASFLPVPALGTVSVNFSLQLGAPVEGTITEQGTGQPIAGIDIDVFTQTGQFVDSVNATTDGNGDYIIGAFPAGNYVLRADPDPATFYLQRYYLTGHNIATANVIPVAGVSPVTGIDIQLLQGGLIHGTVQNANTFAPLSGVDLDVFDSLGVLQRANAATVASGTYELGPMLPGTYTVRADPTAATHLVATYHPNSLTQAGATLVTVVANSVTNNVDIDVPPGGAISGIVRAAGTLAPLANIDIDVFDLLGVRMPVNAKTDVAGAYLIGALPPGQYRIRTDPNLAQGYAVEYYSNAVLEVSGALVTVNQNLTTPNINFELDQGAVIEGVITGSDTLLPLVGVDLDLFTPAIALYPSADAVTSATGFFRLGPVPPGTWVLQADPTVAQGYTDQYYSGEYAFSRATPMVLAPGQTRTGVNMALDTGGWISGTVRLASNNQPFQGCDLDVYLPNRRRVDVTAKSDVNGNFTLGLLPAGQYVVRADAPIASGLLDEYYNEVPDITSSALITVSVGQTTTPVNFTLSSPQGDTPTPTATSPEPTATPTSTNTSSPTTTPTITDTPAGPTPTVTDTPIGPTPTITDTPVGPTPTPTPNPDINSDLHVDFHDLLLFVQQWKSKILDPAHSADIDRDGVMETDDLLRIVREWKVDIAP